MQRRVTDMGLFGKFLGATKNDAKVAKYEYKKAKSESKERKKEAARNEKEGKIKSIQEGAQLSLNYAKNNYESMCEKVSSLYNKTLELIAVINDLKSRKLSRDEKKQLVEAQEEAPENLEYLYLAKDYFIFLTRLANGMALKNEQMLLLVKFGAFFDGVDVLSDEDDEDVDDSLLADFKEIGRDFKEMFVSSKKQLSDFNLRDYVEEKYCDEIDDLKLPEIETALDAFEKLANKENTSKVEEPIKDTHQENGKTVECPNCHCSLPETAKFCPKCGTKIEPQGPAFCMECGSSLRPGAKFCPKCGAKINR